VSTKSLCVAGMLLLVAPGGLLAGAPWFIDWWRLEAGGVMQAGGDSWTLSGTIGQWEATQNAASSGGDWSLTGGFWSDSIDDEAPPSDDIFRDRFEP